MVVHDTSGSSQSLKVEVYSDSTEAMVSMTGVLDEKASLKNIQLGEPRVIIFELSGLRLLNSSGIRTWVHWIRELEAKSPRPIVLFRKCTKPFIDQVNAISGFLPQGATVESFFVPYYCENCGQTQSELFVVGKQFSRATADSEMVVNSPKAIHCLACGEKMEMDVMPAKYFSFLQYRR